MESEKIDQALLLSFLATKRERSESAFLEYGFEKDSDFLQVIVRHIGEIKFLEQVYPDTKIVELLNGYAIIFTRAEWIEALASRPEISYIEKPKRLFFNLQDSRTASCFSGVQKEPGQTAASPLYGYALSGAGTLIGIIDSGIDYRHPAFINEYGESRIAWLWDQAASPFESPERIPAGYGFGAQYSKETITSALSGEISLPLTESLSGHGTAVAGIAAGNGNGSPGNRYRGAAPECELIVVRLGRRLEDFSGTTEVMMGIDYAVRKAIAENKPLVINLSFGTNDGSHGGQSLFETYLADLIGTWKNVIIVASGNEGDSRHHSSVRLFDGSTTQVEFAIGNGEKNLSLQIWKDYADLFDMTLTSPSGDRFFLPTTSETPYRYQTASGELLYYYGAPTPFTTRQPVFLEWLPGASGLIESGIWILTFSPKRTVIGRVHLWLPTVEAIGTSTGFFAPDPDTTLTIPSTARNVITVGAYDTATGSIAPFSGRGNTIDDRTKPTLVAPGVNVMTTLPDNRYGRKTGTSIAAPFVAGSAALLMEWGIVKGNDPFLYGEKIKACLIRGARRLNEQTEIPDTEAGFGALCVRDSFPD